MKQENNTLFGRFVRGFMSFMEAPPEITDVQKKRQLMLLSALLLIIILLGTLSGLIQLILVPGFFPTFVTIAVAVAILCFAYILARAKYYLAAAILTSLIPLIASYAVLLTHSEDLSAFAFMLISVLLSSILLNRWLTVGVALLDIFGLFLLPHLQPAWGYPVVAGKISFHLLFSALILIAMWHRDLVERDRQKELRESELKFRSMFDTSVDAIGVSRSGIHVMANPAYLRMFKYESIEGLVGASIVDLIAPSHRGQVSDYVRRRAAGEDVPSNYETRGLRRDGLEFDMDVHVSTYEQDGELYTVPILRDITERKRTEEALRASEIRYRAIVENTPDLICRFLPDTTLTFVNEAYCRYFGRSRDQLIGTRFLDLIPKNEWEGVQKHVDMIIHNKEPFTYSHAVITPGGDICWQQWTDNTILDDNGDVTELQSVGRDITEQKMAEKSLQESERRFREMLQGVNLAGVMLDKTGRITFINDFLLRITGWSQEDALGKDWFDQFLPADIREDIRTAFGKMLIGKEIFPHYENEIISRHGGHRLIRWNNTTLFDTNGDVTGSASIGEDITESRHMERSLRLSEEKFSKAFRASPDVIVLTSLADGRILEVNDSLLFLSGYSREEVIGKTTTELQFWARPADREQYITSLQRDGRVRDLEVGFRVKSGEIRQALLSGEIIELADGKYILGVIRDITERKKTEQALRSSEERYRLLFENNPQPMWVYDTTTLAFLAVNDAAINAYGYSRDEFLGMTIKDIRPADDLPRLMNNISHLTGGLDHAGYWRHARKNGEIIDVEITSHTFLFEGREAELVLAGDVTERKRTEEALRLSEERYRTLAQNLPDSALLLYDQDLRFIIAEGPELEATGFSREELEGKTLYELPAEFTQLVEPNMRRILGGEKFSMEVALEDRFYRYSYAPLRDGLGNVVMAMILATNITQLKQVEDALKDSQRRLSTALHATKVGVWEWDMQTNKAYWSDENYRVLGLDPGRDESKYENWAKCVHPDDLPAAEAKVAEAINNKSELNIEFRVVWPDGSIHWINDIGSILMDKTGQPLGMYGIQMDVTERKQAEEEREALINQLEAKNAELERFTYTVSHDLKSPLVTIKGFLGFLKQDIASGNVERQQNDIERISRATIKMEQLLRDLLELSRIGRLINPLETIPFEDLIVEALEIVQGSLEVRNVTVHVQPDLPVIYGDRQRLVEVLQNLFDNAAKYMGDQKDPQLEIGQRGQENGLPVFFVRDNGMGIPPEHHERIFGLFNKLDARSEGTGVGLALVRRIIDVHGGRIWVESEAGKGSTFLFTLPAGPEA